MPRSVIEAQQMKHETKIKKLVSETQYLNVEKKKNEDKFEELQYLYVDKEKYESDFKTFAFAKEIREI